MKLIRTAQGLFLLDVSIWVIFGLYGIVWVSQNYPQQNLMAVIAGVLIFGNASVLLLSAFLLGKGKKLFYYFALAVLVLNIIAGLMDQMGVYDYAFLLFELILLVILISIRKYYS